MNTMNLSSASNVFLLLADVVLTILVAMHAHTRHIYQFY
jgi:hypothetical protein